MTSIKVDPASVTEKDKKPAELEAHLKNPDFFDVEKILFQISKLQA
jgi:polyisoprenoid-binding protein YceI